MHEKCMTAAMKKDLLDQEYWVCAACSDVLSEEESNEEEELSSYFMNDLLT